MEISQLQGGILQESHSLLFNEAIWANIEKRMLAIVLQSNSSNCLVLILHRQLGNYLLSIGERYSPTYMQDFI